MSRAALRMWWEDDDFDNVRVCRDPDRGHSQHLVETNIGLLQWRDHEPCGEIDSIPTTALIAWLAQGGMRDE